MSAAARALAFFSAADVCTSRSDALMRYTCNVDESPHVCRTRTLGEVFQLAGPGQMRVLASSTCNGHRFDYYVAGVSCM